MADIDASQVVWDDKPQIDSSAVKWDAPGYKPSWLERKLDFLPQPSPEKREIMRQAREHGWGSGVDLAAYNVGGKITDATGSPALGYAGNVAMQAVPALFGGQIARGAAPALESAATSLMTSALKPTLSQNKRGIGPNAVQTMLDEGLNATAGGVQKLKDRIGQLNQDISDAISSSSAAIDPARVTQALASVYQKFRNQVNPQSDIAAIDAAKDAFLQHPQLQSMASIPVQLAQDLKQGTYRVLKGKYGQIGSAETEAQKGLARGLKEEIAAAVPEVSSLNARESNLLDALNVAERRTMVDANKNPLGLAPLAHGSSSAVASFLADRSALVKSLLARGLYSGSETLPFAAGAAGGGILGMASGSPQYIPGLGILAPQR